MRLASLVLLVGSVLFFIGMAFPAFRGVFDTANDEELIAYIEANFGQYRLAWVFGGLGTSIAGAGLWMWGRGIASMVDGRSATAASVAAWLGAVGVPNGVIRSAMTFGSASTAADPGPWLSVVPFIIYSLATTISMVTLGWLITRGPLPTWLGVVFILCGIAAVGTFLPLFWYVGGFVAGVAGLLRFRPQPVPAVA